MHLAVCPKLSRKVSNAIPATPAAFASNTVHTAGSKRKHESISSSTSFEDEGEPPMVLLEIRS
jgi:hypothetical protein